jgi:hypothetical protein
MEIVAMKKLKVDMVLLLDEIPDSLDELAKYLAGWQILDEYFFEADYDPDPNAIRAVGFDWQTLRVVEEVSKEDATMPSGSLIDGRFYDDNEENEERDDSDDDADVEA